MEQEQSFEMDFLRPEVQREYLDGVRVLLERVDRFAREQEETLGREIVSHMTFRLKSEASIRAKLKRKGRAVTNENIEQYINDLAGIRIVCLYLDDVDRVRDFLMSLPDIQIYKVKDFIKKPKNSGYQSLHLQLRLPNGRKAEIQIRTMGMDYWSVMEHGLQYKKKTKIRRSIKKELLDCARGMRTMDQRMQAMRRLLDDADQKS